MRSLLRPRAASVFAIALLVVVACGTSGSGGGFGGGADGGMIVEILDATIDGEISASDDGGPAPDGAPVGDDDDDGSSSADAGFDAGDASDGDAQSGFGDGGSGNGTISVGASNHILLKGTIVTPDVSFVGEVLVVDALISCVAAGTTCETSANAGDATVIDTKGVIAPGLIDTHNHILFDIFDNDDWLPAKLYTNHNQWTAETRYQAMLDVKQCLDDDSQGKPTWCPATYTGTGSLKCEMDKWGELKGMIAGTTSIVGLPGTSAACFSSLSRSIDVAQNGLGSDHIQTSATFPPSRSAADGVCSNFTSMTTAAYLIHCGEGTDAPALAEWTKLGTAETDAGCLYAPETVVTHATAFTASEFAQMAGHGMKITWSPASNVALYGATTDIPAALDAGVAVALGPDWSMGGSQNLLDEMRYADNWDNGHFGDKLSAKDLVLMTTKTPAAALGLSNQIGSIAVGLRADLMVVTASQSDPYASILAAKTRNVVLTMVDGKILYGDANLKAAGPTAPGCEDIAICGASKFLCVATTATTDKLDQTYAVIKAALEAGLSDADQQTPSDGFTFAPLAPLDHCN